MGRRRRSRAPRSCAVSNAAPVLAGLTQPGGAALPATVVVAQSLDLRALFTDPGENDTHVAELDCGEGYGPPAPVDSPFDRTCTFGAVGPRTIRVRVTDDDGAAAVRTHALTVTYNVEGFFEPVARSRALTPWRAGQAIPLKWRVTDYDGKPVLGLSPDYGHLRRPGVRRWPGVWGHGRIRGRRVGAQGSGRRPLPVHLEDLGVLCRELPGGVARVRAGLCDGPAGVVRVQAVGKGGGSAGRGES